MPNNNKLYDKEKIIAGLVIFLALFTFPFWYNHGKAAPAPKLVLTKEAKAAGACIRTAEYMKAEHMQILNDWRHIVTRDGRRIYINPSGKEFVMSLSNTCLDCHANKAEFCDRCHNYASVSPYCWDCHIDNPKEIK
jgi:hypothetical protein